MAGVIGGDGDRAKVFSGKGCSKLFPDFSSSFRRIPSFFMEPMSPMNSVSKFSYSPEKTSTSTGPFSGLVICVTGLSKETRKQVKEATERLGGQYSPHLHDQCSHLVVQSSNGRKFMHALKHGTNSLLLVTIGWFVDSVKNNVRLNEALYGISRNNGGSVDDFKQHDNDSNAENINPNIHTDALLTQESKSKRQTVASSLSGEFFYIDEGIPAELRNKVVQALSTEGASLVNQWFVGCNATYVVCEGLLIQKYLGHSSNVVTPLWVLKSAKEHSLQRSILLSVDLARFTGSMLGNMQHDGSNEAVTATCSSSVLNMCSAEFSHEERQRKVTLATDGVRKRRNLQMQTGGTPIRLITPITLLDSICWTISEPTSTVAMHINTCGIDELSDAMEDRKETGTSFVNNSRPLTESEKSELIFKGSFMTILFPVDQFSETGPCSKTFFSNTGFTCLQILDHIFAFYQANMSPEEIEISIETDSRHADNLRAAYSAAENGGLVVLKRIEFLGSRKSFEMLKRVSGDYNGSVYELLIRA